VLEVDELGLVDFFFDLFDELPVEESSGVGRRCLPTSGLSVPGCW
jgi:hypothetical protein